MARVLAFRKPDQDSPPPMVTPSPNGPKIEIMTKEEEMRDDVEKVGAFLLEMDEYRLRNNRILWSGENAKEQRRLVSGYSYDELIFYALNATSEKISKRPFFYSAIAYEIDLYINEARNPKPGTVELDIQVPAPPAPFRPKLVEPIPQN